MGALLPQAAGPTGTRTAGAHSRLVLQAAAVLTSLVLAAAAFAAVFQGPTASLMVHLVAKPPMATPPCRVPLAPGALSAAAARLRARACAAEAYAPDLPLSKLRAGVTLAAGGPGRARLRRAMRRLAAGGGPVRLTVIGGSITWGDGVGARGRDDWFALVTSYLKKAFPAADIAAVNSASPATLSEYVSMCLSHYVDPMADIVFVECEHESAGPIYTAVWPLGNGMLSPEPLRKTGWLVCLTACCAQSAAAAEAWHE